MITLGGSFAHWEAEWADCMLTSVQALWPGRSKQRLWYDDEGLLPDGFRTFRHRSKPDCMGSPDSQVR